MVRRQRAAESTAAAAVFVAVVIVGVAVVASLSTLDQSQTASCSQPAYLVRLASQVEQTQSFAQASHGLNYVLSMSYRGMTYVTRALIEPMSTTYVALRVPSGNVTTSAVAASSAQ
jgi:hypothetical protein